MAFNPVTSGGMTGASVVSGTNNTLLSHNIPAVNITRNGYLYIYCSNESDVDVFFDNLQVIQTHGPLVEETHYYPFGLSMAGISSKALSFGDPGNNKKYNGIEYDSSFGLDEYEAKLRDLDPQIGRWWQIDPDIEDDQFSESPYQAMDNDPSLKSDPKGDEACCAFALALDDVKTTERVAGAAEAIGLGPEDPVADAAAIVINVGGLAKATWDFLTKTDVVPLTRVNVTKKGPKDLVQEAKDQKQKEADAAARAAKRKAATQAGKAKVGQSNSQTQGDHNSNVRKSTKNDHDIAQARRAAEQAAAAAKKAAEAAAKAAQTN